MRVAILFALALPLTAQWIGYPDPKLPRTKDGKPKLTAPAPRVNGHPDFSGVWHVLSESTEEKRRLFGPQVGQNEVPGMEAFTTSKYAQNITLDYKPGEIVLTPKGEALSAEIQKYRNAQNGCMPYGMVRATLLSEVQKIVQTPDNILIMLELDNMTRQIHTDGRKLPVDPVPSWMGYSIGRWEKDTLVVETIGFNGRIRMDANHPIGPNMKITERYRRLNVGTMEVEYTFDDPETYNKPFSVKITHLLQPDTDILEYVCNENEKDFVHLVRN